MSGPRPPERLLREVTSDLRPVRPLPPPAWRAANVALWGAALVVVVTAVHPLREDAAFLGPGLLWGVAGAEALAGLFLAALALREAVPGSGVGPARVGLALAMGAATQVAAALWTWTSATIPTTLDVSRHRGVMCFSAQEALGLPGLALALWLVRRALPVRPRWSGALAGLSAGLLADGVWHLVCPRADLEHVLVWHGGATLLTTAAGWLLGALDERRAAIRFEERHRGA